ncbi:alpha/beta hydrolase [Streptomyces sp. NPDC004285]
MLGTVRTHAFPDAPLAPGLRDLPLVVLSPGFTRPRATLTSIGEDLASHGYVVVAIDHTYETAATTFPDGRVAACHGSRAGRVLPEGSLRPARAIWRGSLRSGDDRRGLERTTAIGRG